MANNTGIYTAYKCDNDELVINASSLYLKKGYKVADVTYGKGVFWRQIDTKQFDFHPSDLLTCPNASYDFKSLPYESNTFDAVIFDPPYVHNPGDMIIDPNYRNAETTKGMYHLDITELYEAGMLEAHRILKEGGSLWVKCKDEIESSVQRFSHIEIYLRAMRLGFYVRDLFILMQKSNPIIQHKVQQHARKNHSYLWIFEKRGQQHSKKYKVQSDDVRKAL